MYWTEIGEMEKGVLKERRQKPAQNLTFPFLQPPLVVVLPPHIETRWGAWLGPLRGSFSKVGVGGVLFTEQTLIAACLDGFALVRHILSLAIPSPQQWQLLHLPTLRQFSLH